MKQLVPFEKLTKPQQNLVWGMHECHSLDCDYSNTAVLNRLVRKGWAKTFSLKGQTRRNGKPLVWYALTKEGQAGMQNELERIQEAIEISRLGATLRYVGGGTVWLSGYNIRRETLDDYVARQIFAYAQDGKAIKPGREFYSHHAL